MEISGAGHVVKTRDNSDWKPQDVTNEDLYTRLQCINSTHRAVNGQLQDVTIAFDVMQVAMKADQERQQMVHTELRTMMSRLADLVREPFRTAPLLCSWKLGRSWITASSAACIGLVAASSGSATKNSSYSD